MRIIKKIIRLLGRKPKDKKEYTKFYQFFKNKEKKK
jgi:hypothetical protein